MFNQRITSMPNAAVGNNRNGQQAASASDSQQKRPHSEINPDPMRGAGVAGASEPGRIGGLLVQRNLAAMKRPRHVQAGGQMRVPANQPSFSTRGAGSFELARAIRAGEKDSELTSTEITQHPDESVRKTGADRLIVLIKLTTFRANDLVFGSAVDLLNRSKLTEKVVTDHPDPGVRKACLDQTLYLINSGAFSSCFDDQPSQLVKDCFTQHSYPEVVEAAVQRLINVDIPKEEEIHNSQGWHLNHYLEHPDQRVREALSALLLEDCPGIDEYDTELSDLVAFKYFYHPNAQVRADVSRKLVDGINNGSLSKELASPESKLYDAPLDDVFDAAEKWFISAMDQGKFNAVLLPEHKVSSILNGMHQAKTDHREELRESAKFSYEKDLLSIDPVNVHSQKNPNQVCQQHAVKHLVSLVSKGHRDGFLGMSCITNHPDLSVRDVGQKRAVISYFNNARSAGFISSDPDPAKNLIYTYHDISGGHH